VEIREISHLANITLTENSMGLFDSFRQAAGESPGRVLLSTVESAREQMAGLSQRDKSLILQAFVEKREALITRRENITLAGVLHTSMDLQRAGNKLKKTSPLEGYPLLLAGVWLESKYRPGQAAVTAHEFLEDIALSFGGTAC
jgi:hypothetical protein